MKRSFSFIEKPVLFILRSFPSFIPGIEKVVAIYYSEDSKRILSHSITKDKDDYTAEELSLEDSTTTLRKLRTETAPSSWLRKEDIPFEIKSHEKVQLNIFNELTNNVLLLRFRNNYDGLNDLYFVYFNENLSNFGIVNTTKVLSTDNKVIIAHILRNVVLSIMTNQQEDRELFSDLQENTRTLVFEIGNLKSDLERTKEKFSHGIVQLCLHYLHDLSKNNNRVYRLSENAVDKLKDFEGDYNDLMPILEKAALFAESLHFDNNPDDVLISDFHINTDKPVKRVKETPVVHSGEVPVKYTKTLILLDKLETAALNVKSKNKLLTSANIGHEFPTPITPPAISDALKKHRNKIIYLFKEYPDRWEIIRNEFRPVQNILNVKQELRQLTA
jgi:hypothetical protein